MNFSADVYISQFPFFFSVRILNQRIISRDFRCGCLYVFGVCVCVFDRDSERGSSTTYAPRSSFDKTLSRFSQKWRFLHAKSSNHKTLSTQVTQHHEIALRLRDNHPKQEMVKEKCFQIQEKKRKYSFGTVLLVKKYK